MNNSVKHEFAVLRFRALFGTESFDEAHFAEKCQQCLYDSFKAESEFFESVKKLKFTATKPSDLEYTNDTKIGGRKMLCFTLGLQPAGYSSNQVKHIKVYVAAEMDSNINSAANSKEFCENNRITIINNLFSFAQMGYDEAQGCAEKDIMEFLKSKLNTYGN